MRWRRLIGAWSLLVLGLSMGCKKEDKSAAQAQQKAAAERAEEQAAAEHEATAGKQALARWAARMKNIRASLPATAALKTGCETLKPSAPLETVDSPLLDSIQSSASGSVATLAASGFATLQSSTVRNLFYEAHALGSPNWGKVTQFGNQLDGAALLVVFELSAVEQPSLVTQDSYTGGGMKGALVVFDLAASTAVCRIPLRADAPTKSQIEARSGKLEATGPDLQKAVLDATALEIRKKAEAALAKLGTGVTLAEPFRP